MYSLTQAIDVSDHECSIAPCLRAGLIAEGARALVSAARNLPNDQLGTLLRVRCVPKLFELMESVFSSGVEPAAAINRSLLDHAKQINERMGDPWPVAGAAKDSADRDDIKVDATLSGDVKHLTGNHYGRLFREFSSQSYWDEPVRLLRTRLERNDIALENIASWRVLDDGCGGGRYSVAWRLLGAKEVVGIDASTIGIADARLRVKEAGIDRVSFEEGNVLALPFPDNTFEVIFSNGVLHHTTDWETGVKEMLRVLKPGGLGWLYLIENPGGLFWDIIEILRVIMRREDREQARLILDSFDIPANRIFYMLDHVMVPINVRLKPQEIKHCIASSGGTNILRLKRGADFDRVERIYQKDSFAEVKFGVGENRYIFSK